MQPSDIEEMRKQFYATTCYCTQRKKGNKWFCFLCWNVLPLRIKRSLNSGNPRLYTEVLPLAKKILTAKGRGPFNMTTNCIMGAFKKNGKSKR